MFSRIHRYLFLLLVGLSFLMQEKVVANLDSFQPYVGITGGVSALNARYRALNAAAGDRHFATGADTDALLGVVLGAQTSFCNQFSFALQANGLYNDLKKTIRSSTSSTGIPNHVVDVKNHFQWGVDARLGWNICHVAPYIIAGFEAGKWRLGLSNQSTVINRGIPALSSLHFSKTLWGPKAGLGVTFPILCNLFANIEYTYTWYGKIHTDLIIPATTTAAVDWNHEIKIRQNAFTIGLNYFF